ncbi:hypothetical protein KVR01_009380 [Diaporthe batatas]|uniref:uncharacterized protein n=1 Tax=Diaporthe batatas TaxID=748121 RepID=UPI001D0406AB|nr:uncharacterized protein KVR01_009380 [Diaporthe batatas]KAG8161116.1 hypothetical protein KVR01_009380 [Diaporthe batatas]
MATTRTQLRPLSISTPPPADKDPSILRRDSISNRKSLVNTSPEQRLVRRSSNRSSWSSASNTSPTDVPSPLSDSASAGPRKFRLPVRVSTQPSFGTSDSSPQARRRSLSLSSDPKTDNKAASDLKRRTRNLYLSQLDEDKAEELRKSPRPSPRVASPPPPYERKGSASTETLKVSDKAKDSPKPAGPADAPKPAPVAAAPPTRSPAPRSPKSPRKQQPAPTTTTPSPKTTITPAPQKMSSSSSPEPQRTGVVAPNPGQNPNQPRGFDMSMQNGQMKGQVGHSLPLPGLSGTANGPAGNLLKGPVDDHGNLKAAALTVGIKLDLEAEVHLSARVRGDILVGLY